MSEHSKPSDLIIRGQAVGQDGDGLIRLNDIWTAAGFTKNQRPGDWVRLPTTLKRIERVLELITGKSRNYTKADIVRVLKTRIGSGGGTYADVRLALDYAEYLNPKLAIEVKEVFLRYKAADPTLADEILERASPEANRWAGMRAMTRSNRNSYTLTLKTHGVAEKGYMNCTEAVYQALLGGKSYQLRAQRGLPPKTNLRDHMSIDELAYIMAAEALSAERIEEEARQGNIQCADASSIGAMAIKQAIEADRRNRQKPML
ncbi:KilA-N domain-containing protein [uncultured Sphingomonas sp.]|uniref:KilA-N domain-containing protein n=1 Tax=uncultured Sphingomonas sp. TaxID=158754 RepID=UPI002609A7BF|nr:KilA-N domain-containing protein [uncultured Sphingomonas sp.]